MVFDRKDLLISIFKIFFTSSVDFFRIAIVVPDLKLKRIKKFSFDKIIIFGTDVLGKKRALIESEITPKESFKQTIYKFF
mmetsp:Transcript_23058/g.53587  ORF Transcript_23058/g.53587 Transcript_23058/m.53587 type:complete len:80 (+) Transcript_23058:489-728(+)